MLSWEMLVFLAVFLAVALGSWGLMSLVADRRKMAGDRLERLVRAAKHGQGRPGGALAARRQEKIQRIVQKAATTLAKPLEGKEEEIGKIRLDLLNAGFRGEHAPRYFLAIKFALLVLSLAGAVPAVYFRYGFNRTGFTYLTIAAGFAFYLPTIVLGFMKKARQEQIFLSLPDALDLMVVCVEAGLGLDAAMRRVASELADACPAMCEEFQIANFQVQMGRARREVLHDLGRRTGVADVRSLAAILIQAERFGSSIATALRVQSDSMRTRRRQLAEERAAKTAVQLIFPLVLFIFPGIFVVLVGPAGIQISETIMK
jgi:tight adherence protein C